MLDRSMAIRWFTGLDGASMLGGYTSLVDKLIEGDDGANLFRVDPIHLLAANAILSIAVDGRTNQIVSGAHAIVDGLGCIHLQGVATDPAYRRRGIGRTIFARALVGSASVFNSTNYRLSVRELNGIPAPEASSLYESFKFRTVNRLKVVISGSALDAHLRLLADGARKDHFFARTMAADIEALQIARALLVGHYGGLS